MKIQDAIKQAGEGGKIFKREWTASGRLGVFKDCNNVWKWVNNGQDFRPSMNVMLAEDWEVVAPDIRKGDKKIVVKGCTAWKESNKRFASLLIEGVELKEGSKYTAVLPEETE